MKIFINNQIIFIFDYKNFSWFFKILLLFSLYL